MRSALRARVLGRMNKHQMDESPLERAGVTCQVLLANSVGVGLYVLGLCSFSLPAYFAVNIFFDKYVSVV